jgi:hypothetical protein
VAHKVFFYVSETVRVHQRFPVVPPGIKADVLRPQPGFIKAGPFPEQQVRPCKVVWFGRREKESVFFNAVFLYP